MPEEVARKVFGKFNGQYMFPESHAYAFGVTAYQCAWLKRYYPLEFYVALFNQQPMGFYNLESLKEDARRHGIAVLNPDVNLSREECTVDEGSGSRVEGRGPPGPTEGPHPGPLPGGEGTGLRLGLLNIKGVGEVAAKGIVQERDRNGPYRSLADLMVRAGLLREALESLAEAGALDSFGPDRRLLRWEIGLRYRPPSVQLALPLPVEQDLAPLPELTPWERMEGEYRTLALYPNGHLLAHLRPSLPGRVFTSHQVPPGDPPHLPPVLPRKDHPGPYLLLLPGPGTGG